MEHIAQWNILFQLGQFTFSYTSKLWNIFPSVRGRSVCSILRFFPSRQNLLFQPLSFGMHSEHFQDFDNHDELHPHTQVLIKVMLCFVGQHPRLGPIGAEKVALLTCNAQSDQI